MKEFLKKIGIQYEGTLTDDNTYEVIIPDSNAYSKVFSALEKSKEVLEVEDDSAFDLENNTLYFETESYDIELNADLNEDKYSLVIKEKVD